MSYSVSFSRSARKELEALDAVMVRRIVAEIEALSFNPRPAGVKKLAGYKNVWRVRVGAYRILYEIFDDQLRIDVINVRHRREAYR